MILGFAHITKNIPYGRGFNAVANSPAKWPLMARHAIMHWLSLVPNQNGLTEEVVEYDTELVEQPGRLDVKGGIPCVSARQTGEAAFFAHGLGFLPYGEGKCGDTLHLRLGLPSANPKWRVDVGIDFIYDAPIDPPLDIAGYAALAFYSSDVEADRDHMLKHGGRTPTEPFTVKLDREMKIVMLRSPEGTIIELIQVLT